MTTRLFITGLAIMLAGFLPPAALPVLIIIGIIVMLSAVIIWQVKFRKEDRGG